MKKFYSALLVVLLLAPFNSAFAKGGQAWNLGVDLSYLSNKTETASSGNTASSQSSTTFYDLSLGYMISDSVMVGAMYATKNSKDDGATVSTSTPASALGAMIGYSFSNGVYFSGTYFLSATDGDYKKGSGYNIDFGWKYFMGSSFYLGAKLAYRSLKYTENDSLPALDSITQTTIVPYLSLGFGF